MQPASPATSQLSGSLLPASMPPPGGGSVTSGMIRLPILLICSLFGFLLLPRVQQNSNLTWTIVGVGTAMLLWQIVLWRLALHRGRPFRVEVARPVPQHYIQSIVQLTLYAYWGWYWRPLYEQTPLILLQMLFIFAFDALFSWSRGRSWRFSSGPLPIVLSTNLFIWFVDDWFGLQFAMIITGLLGKEFLKWRKEGRRTHIFNPSGFGLLVAALCLIATGTTDSLTLARPLATTIDNPPQIFLVLFLLGVVVQGFFAVTLMTFTAVLTTVGVNLAYSAATGSYLFAASNLPAAGFLGMHLLMTDPSTSPRTNLGRLLFGAGYGLLYCFMYDTLGPFGDLELYAKLFPVPILNLTVRGLDHLARSGITGRLNHAWETALAPRRMNLVHMAAWTGVFVTMSVSGYLTDPHPGGSIGFWKQAHADGKPQAARKLAMIAIGEGSSKNSGDAFNEVGILSTNQEFMQTRASVERPPASYWFGLATGYRSTHGSRNLLISYLYLGASPSPQDLSAAFDRLQRIVDKADPTTPVIDSLLFAYALETGRGVSADPGKALKLYRNCGLENPIARMGIARLSLQPAGQFVDVAGLADELAKAATAGDAESCWYLAYMHLAGRGVETDEAKARALLQRACDQGLKAACEAVQAATLPPFAPLPGDQIARPAWSTAFPL